MVDKELELHMPNTEPSAGHSQATMSIFMTNTYHLSGFLVVPLDRETE